MSFISYAQNYEDVMLWRALRHINNGFYIDVGAAWPDEHSVTKAFYDRGWRGINIEPNPLHYASLVEQRSRDINLNLGVAEQAGYLTMNLVGDTGLSTLDDSIASQHQSGGWKVAREKVTIDTLDSICRQHVPQGHDINFLKIDVEGLEESVLKGSNWTKYRPWIVLVEATLPLSQQESYHSWEPILLRANYLFAYADGLNRFYVAKERENLVSSLKYPPNVFDEFLLAEHQNANAQLQLGLLRAGQAETLCNSLSQDKLNLEIELLAVKQELQELHQANHHHLQLANQREQLLQVLYCSRSWRITAPLRWPVNQIRLVRQQGVKKRIKAFSRKILRTFLPYVVARPALKHWAIKLAYLLGAAERLKPFFHKNFQHKPALPRHETQAQADDLDRLSPRARRIYADLKAAIAEQQQGGS